MYTAPTAGFGEYYPTLSWTIGNSSPIFCVWYFAAVVGKEGKVSGKDPRVYHPKVVYSVVRPISNKNSVLSKRSVFQLE